MQFGRFVEFLRFAFLGLEYCSVCAKLHVLQPSFLMQMVRYFIMYTKCATCIWTDRRTDGWVDRWMDGWIDGWMGG